MKSLVIPGREESPIYILLSSDANYEPHLWVNISSLIENAHSDKEYYIYVLDGGISNKENFYNLVSKDKRFHIEFINMKDQFVFAYESRHVSKAAYYRLAVFKLFRNFPRIVYLDADSYVLGDIADLYNLPIGNKLIAGTKDSITYEIPWREKEIKHESFSGKAKTYYNKYLGLNERNYFSSGVLLFNLEKMDLDKIQEKLEILFEKSFFSHDQDMLNLLFDSSEVYYLPREWNYFNSAPTLKEENFLVKEEMENYLKGRVSPKIVSYVLKPWEKENRSSPYADLYWRKIKESPYYEEIKEISERNSKLERFKKLSLIEKFRFITSKEAFRKYRSMIKSLLK